MLKVIEKLIQMVNQVAPGTDQEQAHRPECGSNANTMLAHGPVSTPPRGLWPTLGCAGKIAQGELNMMGVWALGKRRKNSTVERELNQSSVLTT